MRLRAGVGLERRLAVVHVSLRGDEALLRRRLLHAIATPKGRQEKSAADWRRGRQSMRSEEEGVKESNKFMASRAGGWQHDIQLGFRWRWPYPC
jgi:hypothetical protein